ncbi:hypothetical protein ACFQZJ_16340 [Maribacter chungangensis]|uniref:PH domain-containing protein n=1 Tax=Maribacter chungangensis TaxID=1069117 RepID=A0ABW3B7Q4_9FLAO
MERKNVIISEGNRPLWQLVIAALHYTVIVFLLFFFFVKFEFTTDTKKLRGSLSLLELALFLLPSALAFSVVGSSLFDLNNKQYKVAYGVGPIRWGNWRVLPEIEYVSVFGQPKVDGSIIFETNLWYAGNRHFNIYQNYDKETVMLMGKSVAKLLKVDLWDSTVAHKGHWVKVEEGK